MRLPLDRARHAALFELLDELERLGAPAVLVGGLVPPLLLDHLDPDASLAAPEPRRTADCDLVAHVSHGAPDAYDAVLRFLEARWARDRLANQFRWVHVSGLRVDLIPVPAGIEAGDPAALAFAARVSLNVDVAEFHHGQEYAIASALLVNVDDLGGGRRPIRVAGLVAMLALKLRAWTDSQRDRRRDAHDIVWLLRYVSTALAVDELVVARREQPTLVTGIVTALARDFADAWALGVRHYVAEAFPERYRLPDDEAESERLAAAYAVQRVLARYAAFG